MATCTHLGSITVTRLPEAFDGCEDCLAMGGLWLHLRIYLECGHVGCCDDSPDRHATAHRSLEPGEDWMRIPAVQGTTRIPRSPLLG